jgi:DNA polymerase-1
LYGSSTAGIAHQLNLPVEEAQRLMDLYFSTFPKVKAYIDSSHRFALLNQFSLTPIGQRKRQYGTYGCFKSTAAYNASMRNSQNYIIQGTTSTIGLVTFAEANSRIKQFGGIGTGTVYDSFEIECPIEHAASVANVVMDTLNTYPQEAFPFIGLPIGMEAELGCSWAETKVIHPGVTQAECEAVFAQCKTESIRSFGSWIS